MSQRLTRRTLLRSAVLASAAHATDLTQSLPAAPSKKPGIQQFMMAAELQKDPPGTLAKLAAIGYGYVEAFATGIPSIPEFRKLLGDAGLGCPSVHFTFGAEPTEKVLDDASALGVRYVISSVLLPPSKDPLNWQIMLEKINSLGQDDFKRMAEQANQIGEAAHKRGILFAYHNHNVEFRSFDGGETGYSILLKGTDPELVKLEVDAGWMAAGGADPAAIIQANASRVRLLHFKDFSSITPPSNELGGPTSKQIVDLGPGCSATPRCLPGGAQGRRGALHCGPRSALPKPDRLRRSANRLRVHYRPSGQLSGHNRIAIRAELETNRDLPPNRKPPARVAPRLKFQTWEPSGFATSANHLLLL